MNIFWSSKDKAVIADLGSDDVNEETLIIKVLKLEIALNIEGSCVESAKSSVSFKNSLWTHYLRYLLLLTFGVKSLTDIVIQCLIISHPHKDHFSLVDHLVRLVVKVKAVILCGNPYTYKVNDTIISPLVKLSKSGAKIFVPFLNPCLLKPVGTDAELKDALMADFTTGTEESKGQPQCSYSPTIKSYKSSSNDIMKFPFEEYLELSDDYFLAFPVLNKQSSKMDGKLYCDANSNLQCALLALCDKNIQDDSALLLIPGDAELLQAYNALQWSFKSYRGLILSHGSETEVSKDPLLDFKSAVKNFDPLFVCLPTGRTTPTEKTVKIFDFLPQMNTSHLIEVFEKQKFVPKSASEPIFTISQFPLKIIFQGNSVRFYQHYDKINLRRPNDSE